MSNKSKLSIIFISIAAIVLLMNNTIYYFSTKHMLEQNLQDKMETVAKQLRISVKHSKLGTNFVEELIGENLRTASIASKLALDPDIEKVTNEQLKKLSELLNISGITLFKQTAGDIIGYRSSSPSQINLSTKDMSYWYTAFQQLFAGKPVTVTEGKSSLNYWTGPFEVSTADPNFIDKWGYYYDGTTNYMIDPYVHNNKLQQYDELTGPTAVVKQMLKENDFLKEITVFNYGIFGEPLKIDVNDKGQSWVHLFYKPILYGTYTFKNKEDAANVNAAMAENKIISTVSSVKGQKVFKSFIPVSEADPPYVVGLVSDYSEIQSVLNEQFTNLGAIILVVSLLSLLIIFVTFKFIKNSKETAVQTTQETYIHEVNELFTTIRGQRHDFLNHVQTMHSMIQMGKFDDLRRYSEELIGEIRQVNDIIRTGHPAIAAIVQSKVILAASQKIDFTFEIADLQKLTLGIKSVDIVKIIGNLVDNAFDEVANASPENRWVRLQVNGENGQLTIKVYNSGRILSEEEKKKIFESGYSTRKDGKHSGIGLAVTKERTLHYKGKIKVESGEKDGILFHVTIPMNT